MSSAPVPYPQIKNQNQTQTSGPGPLAGQTASGRFRSPFFLPELRWAAGTFRKGPRESVHLLTAGSRVRTCPDPELLPTPPAGPPLPAARTERPARPEPRVSASLEPILLEKLARVREELSTDPLVARIPARRWACSAASPRLWSWQLGRWGLRGHFLSLGYSWRFKHEKERGKERSDGDASVTGLLPLPCLTPYTPTPSCLTFLRAGAGPEKAGGRESGGITRLLPPPPSRVCGDFLGAGAPEKGSARGFLPPFSGP